MKTIFNKFIDWLTYDYYADLAFETVMNICKIN